MLRDQIEDMVSMKKKYFQMCANQVYELLASSAVKIGQYCYGIMHMDTDMHSVR